MLTAFLVCGGCGSTPPSPILFTSITDDRVPYVEQTDFEPVGGFNSGIGAAAGDLDGDGRVDLYIATAGAWLNRADPAGFRLIAGPPSDDVSAMRAVGVALGDFDRDGDLDVALAGQGARLLANDGTGAFHDVTSTAGVQGQPKDVSIAVAWGDLDGDGWLDLIVADYGVPMDPSRDAQASHLYLNRRDGSFVEQPLGIPPVRAWVATFADFDGDGLLDLHLGDDAAVAFLDTSLPRHDRVLLNRGPDANGALQLAESSAALGLDQPHATMGYAFSDAGPDAGWDLFVSDIRAGWLYRSAPGGGAFQEHSRVDGIDLIGPMGEQWWQWGAAFADLDGDGREDLLIGQSEIHPGAGGGELNGPLLERNRGGHWQLQRYAFGGPMQGRSIVLADLDGDGDQDAVVAPYYESFHFFVNDSAPRRFVRVQLKASVSAPGAAGAVVTLTSGGKPQKRMVTAGGQPTSAGEPVLDFALPDATPADLEVRWPSGAVQKLGGIAANSLTTVEEPGWITLSDAHPRADGTTWVTLSIDFALAGLTCTQAALSAPGLSMVAMATDGKLSFQLPPRTQAGPFQVSITYDGNVLPPHPTLDYR